MRAAMFALLAVSACTPAPYNVAPATTRAEVPRDARGNAVLPGEVAAPAVSPMRKIKPAISCRYYRHCP